MGTPSTFPFTLPTDVAQEAALSAQDTKAAAVARLAQYIKAKPHVLAALGVLGNQTQDLEQAFQETVFYRLIDNAFGQVLDDLGGVVGQARAGLSDDLFRLYIKARILCNISCGTTEDIYAVLGVILPAGVTQAIAWQFRAAFSDYLTDPAGNLTDPDVVAVLADFLRQARGAGIGGVLEYGLAADAALFEFDGGNGLGFDQGNFRGALR